MKSLYLSLITAFVFCISSQAQTSKDSTLLNRELTLEKEYNPTIENAVKLNQLPELREPQPAGFKFNFSNYAVPYGTDPQLSVLPIKTYLDDLSYSDKKGYITAGFGTLVNINGDAGYQLLNNSKNYLSIYLSHRSSNSKVNYLQYDDDQKMKINDTWGGVDFSHDFGVTKLSLDAKYTYSGFNYYGINYLPSEFIYYPIEKGGKQKNNMLQMSAGLSSEDSDEIGYLLKFGYSLFDQAYMTDFSNGRRENRFLMNLNLDRNFNDLNIGVDMALRTNSYSSVPERKSEYTYWNNKNHSVISLNPHLKFEGDIWNLRIGGKLEFQLGGDKKSNIAPDIVFNLLPSKTFGLYLQARGGMKDNSNYNMFYENRYVAPEYRVKDSRTFLDALAGVTFLPLSGLELNLFTGYEMAKDEHFFVTTSPPDLSAGQLLAGQSIIPEYYDTNLFKFGGAVNYSFQKQFEINAKAVYNKWTTRNDLSYKFVPWGKPSFTADLGAMYRLSVLPLHINARYHLETGREFEMSTKSNEAIHDLSLNMTYTLDKTLSLYVTANNLLFQKYDLWHGYPAQGFNIMGGLSVKF